MQDPSFTEEERERVRKLLSLAANPEHNGHEAERVERRKPRFNGEINLGHVLTILTMGCALATMWVNGRVAQADHETRLVALEQTQKEFKETLGKMAETAQQGMRNQDRITVALEYLTKTKANP